ncbi:TPA: DUF3987 domain-containing protein [Enterobacter hormaechei subsp. xiangfangensis]|nr:DUF3987 domain-containing protein [Enterobacter hormaechei subsp. xiangfangensis]
MKALEFPIDLYPPNLRAAAYDAQAITQAPLALIAISMLAGMSIACQNSFDVVRPGGLVSPTSLFLLGIADSGERKSAVDKLILAPIYDYEEEQHVAFEAAYSSYELNSEVHDIEYKACLTQQTAMRKRGADTTLLMEQIRDLITTKPQAPSRRRIIFNDATIASLKNYLRGDWRSIALVSDEAGSIFSGNVLSSTSDLNKLWDGGTLTIDRANKPELRIAGARLTFFGMIQKEVFDAHSKGKGKLSRSTGLDARVLVCHPVSTQGQRLFRSFPQPSKHLAEFHKQCAELLAMNATERELLYFAPEAEYDWIEAYNFIESLTVRSGELYAIKDIASKSPENIARIAAPIHIFSGEKGGISRDSLRAASQTVYWFIDEYKRLSIETDNDSAEMLYQWIRNKCIANGICGFKMNLLLQYSPVRSKTERNELLGILYSQNRLYSSIVGRTQYIVVTELQPKPIDVLNFL